MEYRVFSRERFEREKDLSENPLKGSLHNFGGFRKKILWHFNRKIFRILLANRYTIRGQIFYTHTIGRGEVFHFPLHFRGSTA